MAPVRILVCASEAPRAPLNGSRLVLVELCSRLARRADVTVLALRRPDQDGPPPAGIELHELPLGEPGAVRAWALRAAALALREPVTVRRLAAPFHAALPELLAARRFDAAHVMLGELAGIAPALDGVPTVLAPLDAWHRNVRAEAEAAAGAERVWRLAQERAVRRWQATTYRRFQRVVLVTDDDAREVSRLDPSLRVVTIANGVDAQHFAPPGNVTRTRVVFTGALSAPANERAAERLARRILPLVPGAELFIVGRAPGPHVRALAALERVNVVADVPDLRPWLWSAAAYVCPMDAGTGIKNKLLEAMAAGAPAVATPLACQGISREHLLVADDDAALAAHVRQLLAHPELGARLAGPALEYVRAHHDWDAVVSAYERLYAEIAG
jgi:glycosyltransferase involved in cell wall biosynthesis